MKTTGNNFNLILLCLALLFSINIYSQKEAEKVKIYKVWVKHTNGTTENGFLYAVDDQSVKIIQGQTLINESDLIRISAKDIYQIKIRRKGKMARSILIGALSGAILGTVVGSTGANDNAQLPVEVYETAGRVSAGVSMVLIGTSIGALVGTGKKNLEIYGDEAVFKSKYKSLIKYTLLKQNN